MPGTIFLKKINWKKIPYLSCGFLITANLIPFYGVLFLHWDFYSLIILYLLESVIFGFFTMLKVSLVNKPHLDTFGCIFLYWWVLIVFWFAIMALFRNPEISFIQVGSALSLMFVSHGFSFITNFMLKEEFKLVSAEQIIVGALERVIIILVVSVVIACFIDFVDNPALPIIFFMVLAKIIIDLLEHIKEHVWVVA